MMTEDQQSLFDRIQKLKAEPDPDKAMLRKLVKQLVAYDDITPDLRASSVLDSRPKGGRSAAFGKWKHGEDYL